MAREIFTPANMYAYGVFQLKPTSSCAGLDAYHTQSCTLVAFASILVHPCKYFLCWPTVLPSDFFDLSKDLPKYIFDPPTESALFHGSLKLKFNRVLQRKQKDH